MSLRAGYEDLFHGDFLRFYMEFLHTGIMHFCTVVPPPDAWEKERFLATGPQAFRQAAHPGTKRF